MKPATGLNSRPHVAIVGSGPAGLMAATQIVKSFGGSLKDRAHVTIYEKNLSIGKKILIAGSSRLNVSHDLPMQEFLSFYRLDSDHQRDLMQQCLAAYPKSDWLQFIRSLGFEVFEGTSGRTLLRDLKAAKFLEAWRQTLLKAGVEFVAGARLQDVTQTNPSGDLTRPTSSAYVLQFESGFRVCADYCVLALGSLAWENQEVCLRETGDWLSALRSLEIEWTPFRSSNVGYDLDLEVFGGLIKECEGKPIKNISVLSSRGQKRGDLVVTRYGLEGTPLYFVGHEETVYLDLAPTQTIQQLSDRLVKNTDNFSPLRLIQRSRVLDAAGFSLFFFGLKSLYGQHGLKQLDLNACLQLLKKLPVELLRRRPLSEAISASGGVKMSQLNADFESEKNRRLFMVGEMLDWDAPTGGFLIQASVSMGAKAGRAVAALVANDVAFRAP